MGKSYTGQRKIGFTGPKPSATKEQLDTEHHDLNPVTDILESHTREVTSKPMVDGDTLDWKERALYRMNVFDTEVFLPTQQRPIRLLLSAVGMEPSLSPSWKTLLSIVFVWPSAVSSFGVCLYSDICVTQGQVLPTPRNQDMVQRPPWPIARQSELKFKSRELWDLCHGLVNLLLLLFSTCLCIVQVCVYVQCICLCVCAHMCICTYYVTVHMWRSDDNLWESAHLFYSVGSMV